MYNENIKSANWEEENVKKALKIFLKIYCVLLIIGTVTFFSVGNFIYSFALLRESVFSKDNVTAFFTGESVDSSSFSGTSQEKQNWLEKNSEEKYITSHDGLSLHGYYVRNPNSFHKYVIACHGYSGEAANMSYYARSFYNMNYSVLAVDARAHGKSEGNVRGMGYLEKRDVIFWINDILKNDPQAEIVLYGVSMGGATVLFTSGEGDLPVCVKAVVSDCAYTNVYDEIGNTIRGYIPFLPSFPIVDSASVVSEIRGSYSFRDASCVNAVKKSTTPTLFIHGSGDNFVPFYMLDVLYSEASCEKEKLVIEGAGHARSAKTDPDLYWSTVKAFLNKHQ